MNAALLPPLAGIWTALGLATSVARLRGGAELAARTRSWWWIVAIVSAVLLAGRDATVIGLAVLCFLALRELLSILPFRAEDRPVLAWLYLAIPAEFALILTGWYGLFAIFLPVYGTGFLLARLVLLGETRGFLHTAGLALTALLVAVYGIGHLGFLVVLPLAHPAPLGGTGMLLFLLVTVQAGDVAQYAAGRLLGGARILPRVSPGKTWAGFAGGLVATAGLGALLGPLLTPFGPASGAATGLLLGALGFAGDVTISAIKRDLGLKDTGALLPGHGGVFDRIDSLVLSGPVFFHLVRYFYGA
jgi:phosphatidate cytidylyltransferase